MSGTTLKYNLAAVMFATQQIDWATVGNTAHCALLNSGYSPLPTDTYLSDIPAGAIMADQAFTSTAVTAQGVCNGAIPLFDAFLSATTCSAMLIYISTGNPATSPLVYFSNQGVGFPFQPEGFNYFVTYDQANGGWFQI